MECSVCCYAFNKTTKKQIECPHCHITCCQSCCKKHILQQRESAYCMSCKKLWNLDFLYANFPTAFIRNEYDLNRANVKMEQQKTLLPSTQKVVHIRNLRKKIRDIQVELTNSTHHLNTLVTKIMRNGAVDREKFTASEEKIKTLLANIKLYKDEYEELILSFNEGDSVTETRKPVLCRCPSADCRGFVSYSTNKCGICQTQVCTKCHQTNNNVEHEHVCKKEDVATTNSLTRDCRACPECKVLIYRSEGCPQMFCVLCHTGFDWDTGNVLKRLDNPYFFDWLLTRNNNNDKCEPVDMFKVMSYADSLKESRTLKWTMDTSNYLMTNDIVQLRNDFMAEYEDLRVMYLRNRIDDYGWVQEIHKMQHLEMKNNETSQALELFCNVSTDLLRNYEVGKQYDIFESEMKEIIEIVNKKMTLLEKRYNFSNKKYKLRLPDYV